MRTDFDLRNTEQISLFAKQLKSSRINSYISKYREFGKIMVIGIGHKKQHDIQIWHKLFIIIHL